MSLLSSAAFVAVSGLNFTWRMNLPMPCNKRAGSGSSIRLIESLKLDYRHALRGKGCEARLQPRERLFPVPIRERKLRPLRMAQHERSRSATAMRRLNT
jgi:hypothetical protein